MSTLMFFLIFGWKITPLLDISILLTIPIYVFTLFHPKLIRPIINQSLSISLILIGGTLYFFALTLANDPSTLQWVLRSIRATISFGAIFILCFWEEHRNPRGDSKNMLFSLAIAVTAHSLLVIVTQIFPQFRHLIYNITQASLYVNEMTLIMDNRPLGLTYSLSITSFVYFVAFAICLHLPTQNLMQITLKAVGLSLNIVACLMTARTGLLFFPFLLILILLNKPKIHPKYIIWHVGFLFIGIFIIAVSNQTRELIESSNPSRLLDAAMFLISPTDSHFGQQYLPMWHLPDGLKQLVTGNSLTGRETGYYVKSDIGYILSIYGTGLIGLLLMIAPIVTASWMSIQLTEDKSGYISLSVIIFTSYLILNAKELALLTRTVWPVVCVFISISLLKSQTQRKTINGDKKSQ